MTEEERKQFLAHELMKAEIDKAFAAHKVTKKVLLLSHVKPAVRVTWLDDKPVVVATDPTTGADTTVDAIVAGFAKDADFQTCFEREKIELEDFRPKVIDRNDQELLNAHLADLAAGRVVITPPKEPVKLADDQVDVRNQAAMNESIADLATGKKTVSFA